MAAPSSEIKVRSGMKGKAVHIIHVYEDYLWAMGDKSGPPELQDISDDEYEEEEEAEEVAPEEEKEAPIVQTSTASNQEEQKKQLTTTEIDEWLKKSLYHCLVYKIKAENASSVLPISASSLYSAYIMPCRPTDVGTEIDIKKSSWKKLQKFLKAMEKAGLLKTKEQRGETMLISVNYSHPSLQDLHKYKTMEAQAAKVAAKPAPQQKQPQQSQQQQQKDSNQAEIQEIFKPLGIQMIKFFEEAKHDKDGTYTIPEVRAVIADYIKIHELVDLQNQKYGFIFLVTYFFTNTPN
jgi:translation initiation factor 2D